MKKQTLKRISQTGCLALAVVIALSAPDAAFASAASTRKDETVYVNLNAAGETQNTIVSDWLHAEDGTQIQDKSDLGNIQNVKTDEKAVRQGDTLNWVLDSSNSGKNIYYQGTTNKKTPLAVSIAYTLDGKPVTADEIAGKTGKVTISLTIKNTGVHTVGVRGKDVTMYTPMTAIAAATLPSDTFKNVTVNSGKVLTDGNNQFVVFVAMPGLSESLGLKDCGFSELSSLDMPETLTIEADTVKFHLPSVAVAATPKLVDSDKLTSSNDLNKLTANLEKLKNVQSELEAADPQNNLRSLLTDPDRTASARLLVDDIFDLYGSGFNTEALNALPQYVNDRNIQLCDRVTSDLDKSDLKYLLDHHVLTGAVGSLSGLDVKKAQALMNDYNELGTFDSSKLNGVKKLASDYDKLGSGLDSVLQDTGNLLNHADGSALTTLGALGGSDVRYSLGRTLNSMNNISGALASSGISSASFDESDIEALLGSYLKRNFSTLAAQAIESNSKNGNISVAKLSTLLGNYGMGVDSILTAVPPTELPTLMTAFLGQNPSAAISISDLSKIQAKGALGGPTLQAIEAAIQHAAATPGFVDQNGKIKVSTLLGMMPVLVQRGISQAAVAELEAQMIPIVLFSNPNAIISDSSAESMLGAVLNGMSDTQKSAMISRITGAAAQKLTPSVNDLLSDSADLQKSLKNELGSDYADKLTSAMGSLNAEKPYLDDLQTDLGKISWKKQDDINGCIAEAEALLSSKGNIDYLMSWAGKLDSMENDLNANRNNIAILNSLMKTAGDPNVKTFGSMLPTLQTDFADAYSTAAPLLNTLKQPQVSADLHRLPEMQSKLMKLKRDADGSKNLIPIFKQITSPSSISSLQNALNTLDGFQDGGTVDSYKAKLDSAQDLLAKKDAYLKLADSGSIFSESADGASTTVKYVYKTAEIKEPPVQPAPVKTVATSQNSNSGGFWGWLRSLFHR